MILNVLNVRQLKMQTGENIQNYMQENNSHENTIEIKCVKWTDENTFNDYICEIYSNNLFTADHFDIGINEIKMKHLIELKKALTNELMNIIKFRVTKKSILQRIKSLSIKHSEQLEVFLKLNEINNKEQYVESHVTNKMMRNLKSDLLEVDLELKNQLIMNHNINLLGLDENTINEDLQSAIDFWNSGETMEY